MMFGCDERFLAGVKGARQQQQQQLCSLVRQLVVEHAAQIWPDRSPDPADFQIEDSSMFIAGQCSGDLSRPSTSAAVRGASMADNKPPMHNVRLQAAAGELHLDVDARTAGLRHENHVNVWVPLNDFKQDPLCFCVRQTGEPVYPSPVDSGDFTRFAVGSKARAAANGATNRRRPDWCCGDVFVGAFPRSSSGECYIFSPLLIPHVAASLEESLFGVADRRSVEFRFERVDLCEPQPEPARIKGGRAVL